MAKELAVRPRHCIGCSTCALTCSLINHGSFDLNLSNIKIYRDDFLGKFELRFLSSCSGCLQCARACPSGALKVLETGEERGESS
ncbi:4Fe-4S binding protein [Desulfotruncus alcoholivorax]|uniref:4Fe-4S binding protein n=1 Tax=Desulfotruncus alcoholivorax TaxID=265477 RepID=UPI00041EC1A0|nr:4Fe-4S binding protein [Desulfotruncus alcoholivorax]